jgi:hypothetical protein
MGCTTMRRCRVRSGVGSAPIAGAYYRCAARPSTIGWGSVISTGIPASTAIAEAMATPAVVIAPASPWAHAQEDAVIEVPRPVIANGRAGVRRIAVVAVGTDGGHPYVDGNLRVNR